MIHQTRTLGVLILCFIYNMVSVNQTYNMVVHAQFHKFYGRSFARVLYLILMKDIDRLVTPGPLDAASVNRTIFHNHHMH